MNDDTQALILAPRGRDANVAASLLANTGIASKAVSDTAALVAALGDDTSLVLVTQEELATTDLRHFDHWLRGQPTWSDLPIVVLTHAGGGPKGIRRRCGCSNCLAMSRSSNGRFTPRRSPVSSRQRSLPAAVNMMRGRGWPNWPKARSDFVLLCGRQLGQLGARSGDHEA